MTSRFQELTQGATKLWLAQAVPNAQQCFGKATSGQVMLGAKGRQAVHKVVVDGLHLVVRHYYRGGFPAHLTKDRYLFRGWQQTRAYLELNLLQDMLNNHLPVPRPIAAKAMKRGVFYTADIATVEIERAQTLAQRLFERKLEASVWSAIGKTIRDFHRLGFHHVDLNARNILLDDAGKIYLIDFDRCVRRPYKKKWAQAGLARLHRSLIKISRHEQAFHFYEQDFIGLLRAYD